jgi:L-malate glycosyltransferase
MSSITFVLPGFSPHPIGGYKMAYLYANFLASRGHAVNVVHMRSRTLNQSGASKRLGLRIAYTFGRHVRPPWFALDRRVRVLNLPEPSEQRLPASDLLIATAVSTAHPVARLSATGRRRALYFIQHFEDFALDAEKVIDTWRLPLKRVVVSRWLAGIAAAHDLDVTLVENGVDESVFNRQIPSRLRAVDVVAMVSDQTFKRTDLAVSVMKELAEKRPNFSARTFGTIKRPLDLPDEVIHHRSPSPEELADIYRSGAIFLCTSDFEGFGLPALEAMSCGAAVVSTDNGGVPTFANDAAVYAPRGDRAELVARVESLLDDPNLLRRMQDAAHSRSEDLTLSRALRRFEDVVNAELEQLPQV